MRSGGQNPQAGLSAQNWAALSLFIQQSFSPSFIKIQLEQAKLADFVLVFQSKRIVCESKSKIVSYPDIKAILDSVVLNSNDEILIICKGTKEGLQERFDSAKYFPEAKNWLVKYKGFTSHHLNLLDRLSFWVVDQSINEEIVKNLLEQRFGLWLPNNELVHELLVERIYKQSANGGEYGREEFINEVERYRQRIADDDDSSTRSKPIEVRVKEIIDAILDPNSRIASSTNPLSVLISTPSLHGVALEQLKKKQNIDLKKWGLFWDATYSSYMSRQVFSVIKDKVTTKENADYAMSFIQKHASTLRYKFNDEFQYKEAAELLERIREYTQDCDSQVAELIFKFYRDAKNDVFYIKKQHGSKEWILGELAESIKRIYASTKSSDVIDSILKFIYSDFNLVIDDSKYWHETPPAIFAILQDYLKQDPLTRLGQLIEKLTSDYELLHQRFISKRPAFNGWELMGGMTSNFAGDYRVDDRTFLRSLVIPALQEISHDEAMSLLWPYIALDVDKVDRNKPDYMNRAAVPFLMREFEIKPSGKKVKNTIKSFIEMTKGIPTKRDLIYQFVRDSNWDPIKKWEILKIGIDKFGQPVDVFMDQILWQLLEIGSEEALKVFTDLLDNDNYMGQHFMWEESIAGAISRIIQNEKTTERGVELLKQYLDSEAFKSKLETFDAYDLKPTLLKLIEKNEQQGFDLLTHLVENKPNRNQQAVFSATVRDMPDRLLLKAYDNLINPLLDQAKDANGLASKLDASETRESIVWFGEKLAKQHSYPQAYRIVQFFMKDPDPKQGNHFDKRILEGDVDQQITTVRGCLPWILMQFGSVGGRDYIPDIFKLTKKLCEDKSIYVRSQACLALETLANNRHTHMPDAPEDWFMPFRLATDIEQTAINMLHDKTNHHPAMMKLLSRVILRIHTLSEAQAVDAINILINYGDNETQEALAHLLIYMAEFREDDFKNWPKNRGDFASFNPMSIKILLEEQCRSGKVELRRQLAFQFAKLPQESKGDFNSLFNISEHYLGLLSDNYDHLVFESIYRLIGREMQRKYEECYLLWRKCLSIERSALEKEYARDKDGHAAYSWWPYFYNGEILLEIASHSVENFISSFDYLADYPDNVIIASDIEKPLTLLSKLDVQPEEIDALFKKLITRNPQFFDFYKIWLENNGESEN